MMCSCLTLCNCNAHILTCMPPLQPSPHRRDERPVSCYTPSSNSHHVQSGLGSAGREAKDKQRPFMPNLVNNETYGTIVNTNPPQPTTNSAPPLPPRNLGKLRQEK